MNCRDIDDLSDLSENEVGSDDFSDDAELSDENSDGYFDDEGHFITGRKTKKEKKKVTIVEKNEVEDSCVGTDDLEEYIRKQKEEEEAKIKKEQEEKEKVRCFFSCIPQVGPIPKYAVTWLIYHLYQYTPPPPSLHLSLSLSLSLSHFTLTNTNSLLIPNRPSKLPLLPSLPYLPLTLAGSTSSLALSWWMKRLMRMRRQILPLSADP